MSVVFNYRVKLPKLYWLKIEFLDEVVRFKNRPTHLKIQSLYLCVSSNESWY